MAPNSLTFKSEKGPTAAFMRSQRAVDPTNDGESSPTASEGSSSSLSSVFSSSSSTTNNTLPTNGTSLVTSTPAITTTPNGTLTGVTGAVSTPENDGDGSSKAGTAVAIIITLVLIGILLVFLYVYMKRKGKLEKLPCFRPMNKKRRSSTSSSRRALGEEHEQDVMDHQEPQRPRGEGDDMFTIDDFEDNPDTHEGKEEYYYDEVFGQSQFEDEATNKAMRQLYTATDTQPEEEMLDFDFETLGIKIDDFKLDPARKNTI